MNDKYADPADILDNDNMEQDLMQLIGYLWTIGSTNTVFPVDYCTALCERFLAKYRLNEIPSSEALWDVIDCIPVDRIEPCDGLEQAQAWLYALATRADSKTESNGGD